MLTGTLALTAVGCLLAATACGSGSSGGADSDASGLSGARFTLMVQSTANVSKVVEVHALDELKQQGVRTSVKWNASSPNIAITQLKQGDIDAYAEALTGGISAVASHVALTDIAVAQPRQDYVFLASHDITSLAQLKGKKIGVQDTTGANYAQALLVLSKAGLNVKDVTISAVGGQSSRLPALVAGRVDATMLSHAAALELKPKGFNVLFDYTKQASNLYDDNIFVTPSWLSKNKKLAVAYNKALLDSFAWFDNPANASDVVTEAMAIEPGQDKQQTTQLFQELRAANAYPQGTIINPTLIGQQQDLYRNAGAIPSTVPIGTLVNDTYAKQAKAELAKGK
jgi:ABC-type nitrate/sulfonate/bicarbonate transport system substrate-binding protein